jgi:uncharacterized membrane protein YcaP (DUF421 family)
VIEEGLGLLVRAVFMYVFALATVRATGRRTLGDLTCFELVTTLLAGDLFDDALWGEVPMAEAVVAFGTVVALHSLTTLLAYASPTLRPLLRSPSLAVIVDGRIQQAGLGRERLTRDELAGLLREHRLDDLAEIESGTLEANGQLAVIRTPAAGEAVREDAELLPRRRR